MCDFVPQPYSFLKLIVRSAFRVHCATIIFFWAEQIVKEWDAACCVSVALSWRRLPQIAVVSPEGQHSSRAGRRLSGRKMALEPLNVSLRASERCFLPDVSQISAPVSRAASVLVNSIVLHQHNQRAGLWHQSNIRLLIVLTPIYNNLSLILNSGKYWTNKNTPYNFLDFYGGRIWLE